MSKVFDTKNDYYLFITGWGIYIAGLIAGISSCFKIMTALLIGSMIFLYVSLI